MKRNEYPEQKKPLDHPESVESNWKFMYLKCVLVSGRYEGACKKHNSLKIASFLTIVASVALEDFINHVH